MTDNQAPVKSTTGRILLLLSAFTLVFAAITTFFDVYKYAITGAVYEMLWLPFLLTLPLVIILGSIKLFREKFSLQSNAFLAILFVCISILIMVLFSRK
jgi:cytochrome bd-type quinol oxidase subunit 2